MLTLSGGENKETDSSSEFTVDEGNGTDDDQERIEEIIEDQNPSNDPDVEPQKPTSPTGTATSGSEQELPAIQPTSTQPITKLVLNAMVSVH